MWVEGDLVDFMCFVDFVWFVCDLVVFIVVLCRMDLCGCVFDGQGCGGEFFDYDDWFIECFVWSGYFVDVFCVVVFWQELWMILVVGLLVMSYCDFIFFNFFVQGFGNDVCLVGVLDGGGFGLVDCVFDFVVVWYLFDVLVCWQFCDGVVVEDGEWFWGVVWVLQQVMGFVWYYEYMSLDLSVFGCFMMWCLFMDVDLFVFFD